MRLALAILLSLATFLLAAKSHGRQVRLERERAGYHQVVFGGSNPPFVEALWRRDRLRFWPTFAVVAVLVALARWRGLGPDGAGYTVWALGFLPFASAFLFAGLWSLLGSWRELEGAALRTTALLWPLVVAGFVSTLWLFARMRPGS